MKKVGLFPVAVVMMALPGCGLVESDDFIPAPSNMAGVYNLTKMTVAQGGATITKLPPEISGAVTLASAGIYSLDYTIPGHHITRSGTYTISEPEHLDPYDPVEDVFVIKMEGSEELWGIGGDGRKLRGNEGKSDPVGMEFARLLLGAIRDFDDVATNFPQSIEAPEALFHLGVAYDYPNISNFGIALSYYNRTIEKYSSSESARNAQIAIDKIEACMRDVGEGHHGKP